MHPSDPSRPQVPPPANPPGPFPGLFATNAPPPAWEYTRKEKIRQWINARVPRPARILVGVLLAVGLVAGVCGWGVSRYTPPPEPDPFEWTAYEDWADAYNLPMPMATATEHFSVEEVSDAIDDVYDLLMLSRVEWPSGKQDRAALIRAFAPATRGYVNEQLGDTVDRVAYVSQLAPGASLVGGVRVQGLPTFKETKDEDGITVLEVHADVTWAYTFRSERDRHTRIVEFTSTTDVQFPLADQVDPDAIGLWIESNEWEAYNVDCGYLYEGLLGLEGTYPGTWSPPSVDPSVDPSETSLIDGC